MEPNISPPPVKLSIRTSKPLRAMLPRGASCTVCRRRKVKCDGVKPACSQCIKSASTTASIASGGVVNCVYELPSVVSRVSSFSSSAQTNKKGGDTSASASKQKRAKREVAEVDSTRNEFPRLHQAYYDDGCIEESHDDETRMEVEPSNQESSTSLPKKKRKVDGGGHFDTTEGGDRVGGLVSRIGELERRIANQAQSHQNPYQLPPNNFPPMLHRNATVSGQSDATYSPSFQHLPNYLHSNPSSRPSSPGGNASSDSSHGQRGSLVPAGGMSGVHPTLNSPGNTSTSFHHPPYSQPSYQQQLKSSAHPSEYYSTSFANGQHQLLPSLPSEAYDLPPYYPQESSNIAGDNHASTCIENDRNGCRPSSGAGEGGEMLERSSPRDGFDKLDARTPADIIQREASEATLRSASDSERHTGHYTSFIPIVKDNISPESPSSTRSYPFSTSGLPALSTLAVASPALTNTSIPSPGFPLSLSSITHSQHQSPPFARRDLSHDATYHQSQQYQQYQQITHERDDDPQRYGQPFSNYHGSSDRDDGDPRSLGLYYDDIHTNISDQPCQQQQLIPLDALYRQKQSRSYPTTLPPYEVLVHLIRVFFARASVPSSLFDKARFLRAVEGKKFWAGHDGDDAPGSSSSQQTQQDEGDHERAEWPEEALLHAICGFSCVFVSQAALGTPYWNEWGIEEAEKIRLGRASTTNGSDGGSRSMHPQNDKHNSLARAYHFDMAKRGIDKAVGEMGSTSGGTRGGRGLFQILQAIIISAYIAYASASFTSLWLLCGMATRLCTPLGLNHLPPWDYANNCIERTGTDWKKQGRAGGFHPQLTRRSSYGSTDTATDPGGASTGLWSLPRTYEEWYERSITFWTAFAVDRHASASTDWSTSIDELDITTLIPCQGPAPRAALSINHPEFLNEFAKPVNSVGRYVKAVVLLGRVVNYIQRLPRFEDLQHDNDGECRTASEFMRSVKATPAFLQLDAALGRFRTATSGMLFDKGDHVDGHLASAYVVPHAASILLHEIFTDPFDRSSTSSIARCLASAKCIVNSTYLLYESSNDLSGCDPFLPFCWSIVSRSLIRDHAIKSTWGEYEAAHISRGLAQHCLSFTARCAKLRGTPIAQLLTANLQAMLDGTDPNINKTSKPSSHL